MLTYRRTASFLLLVLTAFLMFLPFVSAREPVEINPTEDGHIYEDDPDYTRQNLNYIKFSNINERRGYLEWSLATIPDAANIDKVEIKYRAYSSSASSLDIYHMDLQPSVEPDTDAGNKRIYVDAKNGTKRIVDDPLHEYWREQSRERRRRRRG